MLFKDFFGLFGIDVPLAGTHARLGIGNKPGLFTGNIVENILRAFAEFHIAGVSEILYAAMRPGVVADMHERLFKFFMPTLFENLELTLLRNDVKIGGEIELFKFGNGGLKRARPAVVEHNGKRSRRIAVPLGDSRITGGAERRQRKHREDCKKFFHTIPFCF